MTWAFQAADCMAKPARILDDVVVHQLQDMGISEMSEIVVEVHNAGVFVTGAVYSHLCVFVSIRK